MNINIFIFALLCLLCFFGIVLTYSDYKKALISGNERRINKDKKRFKRSNGYIFCKRNLFYFRSFCFVIGAWQGLKTCCLKMYWSLKMVVLRRFEKYIIFDKWYLSLEFVCVILTLLLEKDLLWTLGSLIGARLFIAIYLRNFYHWIKLEKEAKLSSLKVCEANDKMATFGFMLAMSPCCLVALSFDYRWFFLSSVLFLMMVICIKIKYKNEINNTAAKYRDFTIGFAFVYIAEMLFCAILLF